MSGYSIYNYDPYSAYYNWNQYSQYNNIQPYQNFSNILSFQASSVPNYSSWMNSYPFQFSSVPTTQTTQTVQNTQDNNNSVNIPSKGSAETQPQKDEKGLSAGAKWAIGIGITAMLAIGADFLFCKGKHVKSIFNNVCKEKNVENTLNERVGSNVERNIQEVTQKIKFNDVAEAQRYFEGLGIQSDLTKCQNLSQLEHVANSLKEIQNAGVNSQIKSLTFTQFDEHSITEAFANRGLSRDVLPSGDISWALGASEQGHIFLKPTNMKYMDNGSNVVIHEVGHYRHELKDSFLTKWNLENPEALIDREVIIRNIANRTNQSAEQVMRKLQNALNNEVRPYTPNAGESIADMFSLMVENKKDFSDGAMLFYDMFDGGRVPNKLINNVKYDDYMLDLYLRAEDILLNYIK